MEAPRSPYVRLLLAALAAGLGARGVASAANKNNPTSKFYVADVDGSAEVDTGEKVDDLTKQSVYNAEGTVVETQKNASNAMVFSNGTGVFFDEDTRLEVKHFQQEPFLPNRTDMDVEPSISQTQSFVPHGTVALCTSKLVAGSTMVYSTPLGSVHIHGGKVVVTSDSNSTTISMLEGESVVNAGNLDTGGDLLKNGQQAVITPGANGGPPQIQIQDIPSDQSQNLAGKVTMACNAKKTVYFAATTLSNSDRLLPLNVVNPAAGGNGAGGIPGTVTAFDGDNGNGGNGGTPTVGNGGTPTQQIIAVPVAPATPPVQYTTSPASLTTTPGTP